MLVMEPPRGPMVRPVAGSSAMHSQASHYGTARHVAQGQTNPSYPLPYAQQVQLPGFRQNGGATNGSIQGVPQGLFPPLSTPSNEQGLPNGKVPPGDQVNGGETINIMNRRADKEQSLYQICLHLRERLRQVPGFEEHMSEMEDGDDDEEDGEDPVSLMWKCFKLGFPLMTIYNALEPEVPLEIDMSKVQESKMGKAATFKFLQGCLTELDFPPSECFLITDLYGNDTTGFVRVTKVVNRVLDLLSQRGQLYQQEPKVHASEDGTTSGKYTKRQHIVGELVTTERDYVQHLESLQQFKKQVEELGAIPGDAIHDIFLNLNALLDFQRRFLIRIEKQNSLSEAQQNWGRLFINWNETFRGVYEPFIANQKRCNETVIREWDKLRSAGQSDLYKQMVENERVLLGFLLKPFQRLAKYPLLLDQLIKEAGFDDERQDELRAAAEASRSVLSRANAAMDREQRMAAVHELEGSVEDWKGHKIEHFGDLLLYGNFTVLKGDGSKDVEREGFYPWDFQYKVYLFERILLCCKETNPNKQKTPKFKPTTDRKNKQRLQLKGRIFMQNVTEVISIQKPGSYTIQIFWKGDPGVENFVIRFANEEIMRKWSKQVDVQRKLLGETPKGGKHTGTSQTEFTYLKNQGALMENPYREDDGEEDDIEQATLYSVQSEFSMSRNASSTSLRTRSTTGGSGPPPSQASSTRTAVQRFPFPENHGPSLMLHTQFPTNGTSPAERAGNSYFSPTAESPVSFRSSSQSNTYPFPRQATPNNGWPGDDVRFTAPAMGRQPPRDGQSASNGFHVSGRTNQRPSLPAMTASQTAQQLAMTSRLRSASSPDIHNNGGVRRYPNGQIQASIDNIPVPPIPAHMAQMMNPVNRSQNNSPTERPNGLPTRSATQSPAVQRERWAQQNNISLQAQHGYEDMGQHHGTNQEQYMQYHQQQGIRQNPRQYLHSANTTPAPPSTVAYDPWSGAPLSSTTSSTDLPTPNQLKVKLTLVDFDAKHLTLVVPSTITYRTLIDRIDAKLKRTSDVSIAGGTARLRYQDVDKDYLRLDCDEDVQGWIIDWKEKLIKRLLAGDEDAAKEIELFCSRVVSGPKTS